MIKKRLASIVLALALLVLPSVPAFAAEPEAAESAAAVQQTETQAPEEEHSFTYVALGDSITAGIGLTDTPYKQSESGYDMTENYHGYSSSVYMAIVADALGLDRDHATDMGLPGVTSENMVSLLQTEAMPERNLYGVQYQVPGLRQQLQNADLITVHVGYNDTLVRVVKSIGKATNSKSVALLTPLMTGALRHPTFESLAAYNKGLQSMASLTCTEWKDLAQVIDPGIQEICDSTYADTTANIEKTLQELRALNPDAQILILGYYSPLHVIPAWNNYFAKLNQYVQQLAPQYNVTYVPIPYTAIAVDGHPTIGGHRYIARQILKAVQK